MIVLAGLVMGAAVLLVKWLVPAPFADPSFVIRLAAVLGAILLAAIVYFGLVIATGGLDGGELKRAMRRKRPAA